SRPRNRKEEFAFRRPSRLGFGRSDHAASGVAFGGAFGSPSGSTKRDAAKRRVNNGCRPLTPFLFEQTSRSARVSDPAATADRRSPVPAQDPDASHTHHRTALSSTSFSIFPFDAQ